MPVDSKKAETTLRSIKELVELMKKKLDWIELTSSSISTSMRFVREQQSIINDKLDQHTKTLKSHTLLLKRHANKLDALLVDVDQLQQESKALGDEIVENRKTRKEVTKIKQHLGLAS